MEVADMMAEDMMAADKMMKRYLGVRLFVPC